MTQNQIAPLALKLLGIFSIIKAIPLLRDLSAALSWPSANTEMAVGLDLILIGVLASFGLLIVVGLCLIYFSHAIAKKIMMEKELNDSTTELSAKNIQSIAFSIVGLVMVVIAIPHLVQIAVNLQVTKVAGYGALKESISIGTCAYSIGLVTQIVVGILLFFGGKGLSALWFYLQKARPMKDV